jgi:glycosyltransferase involved in cell wall biosynthesis
MVPTGYGVVTRNILYRLAKRGYHCDCLAYYGLEGSAIKDREHNITIYPALFSKFGLDAAEILIHYLQPDLFITLFDVWVDPVKLPQLHPRWIAYAPVDHSPVPQPVYEALKGTFIPLAMSKHGAAEMLKAGLKPAYIPHGVDTNIFKPLDNKKECRKKYNIPEDAFVVSINAANKGMRKDYPRMFDAFKGFLEQNPDAKKTARIYMNTWPQYPEGLDLNALIKYRELEKNVIVTNTFRRYVGIPDEGMAEFYNCADVFLNLARGEGFGIPIIEAQSCGVPAIATHFSSMIELVEGHGWTIEPVTLELTPLLSYQALAHTGKAVDALCDAYNHPDKVATLGRASREFALGYDYDMKILPMWEKLLADASEQIHDESCDKPNVALGRKA